MNFVDPFPGYTWVLRTIVYVLVPAFVVLQTVRFRRALHVFQLEGYKRDRFLAWCRAHATRGRFLASPLEAKKPLAMTGRAWRILVAAVVVNVALVLVLPGLAHLYLGGWPADVVTWASTTAVSFVYLPSLLVAADVVVSPIQRIVNARYLRAARRKLARAAPVVVGITGSYGKTSTKFAIAALLGREDAVLATPASYNTPLGVCRTINEQLAPTHRFFIVEMGAYGEGEIADLMEFVRPRIGVLTAIGPMHLERFGSMDAIRRGKYEVVRHLPDDGVAVMNTDDPEVRALADGTEHVRVVRFGLDAEGAPDVTAEDVEVLPQGMRFTLIDRRSGARAGVETRLLGRHAIGYVLAAAAVALEVGRPLDDLVTPIAELAPVEHRLQLIEGTGRVTVIDDAFNSNPAGAAAALDVLAQMPGKRKVVVTPGIVELGDMQDEANERFGRHAAEVADYLIVVARVNRGALVRGARAAPTACEVVEVDSLADATERLRSLLAPGDVVLFENDLPDQYEG